jgi:hypothetical protein
MVEIRRMFMNFEVLSLPKFLTIITRDNARQPGLVTARTENEGTRKDQKQDRTTAHGSIKLLPPACTFDNESVIRN